jgi:bacteriocin-like protein
MSKQVTSANEQQILAAKDELTERELETVSGGAAVDYFDRASPLFFGKPGGENPIE